MTHYASLLLATVAQNKFAYNLQSIYTSNVGKETYTPSSISRSAEAVVKLLLYTSQFSQLSDITEATS